MLDSDAIATGIVKVIKDVVGSDLSTITLPDSSTTPAVIKARQNGPKPDLPYITVDVANFVRPSGWLVGSGFDENDIMTYQILYEMFVDIKCFGTGSRNILRKLASSYSIPNIADKFRTEVFGASIQQEGQVIYTPDLLSTRFEEGATLTTSFYIVDTIQDPTGTALNVLQEVNGIGTFITGVDGDIEEEFGVPRLTIDNSLLTIDSTLVTIDRTVYDGGNL